MFIPGVKRAKKKFAEPIEEITPSLSTIADSVDEELILEMKADCADDSLKVNSSGSVVERNRRYPFTVAILVTLTMVVIVLIKKN